MCHSSTILGAGWLERLLWEAVDKAPSPLAGTGGGCSVPCGPSRNPYHSHVCPVLIVTVSKYLGPAALCPVKGTGESVACALGPGHTGLKRPVHGKPSAGCVTSAPMHPWGRRGRQQVTPDRQQWFNSDRVISASSRGLPFQVLLPASVQA